MKPYVRDVEQATIDNEAFRRVVHTTPLLQLQLLSLRPTESTGMTLHDSDHFYCVVQGAGQAVVEGERLPLRAGWSLLTPSGTAHDLTNTGTGPLKLFALTAPPRHRPDAVHRTRLDAEVDNGPFEF